MRLAEKVAVITGGGSGIGRATSLLFAEEGASVAAVDIVGDRAEETAELIRANGGSAIGLQADVAYENEIQAAIGAAVAHFGKLDILYNNAGIGDPGSGSVPFEEVTEESWERVIGVNLKGVFFGCKHAVAPMRKNGGGSILITSSIAGSSMMRGFPIYCVSKGGVNVLAKSLALELGQYNIRVNAICPMYGGSMNFWLPSEAEVMDKPFVEIHAETLGGWDPAAWPLPLKKSRAPSFRDVAYAAVYLASDESAYMSGTCLTPDDGGTTIASPVQAEGVQDAVDSVYAAMLARA